MNYFLSAFKNYAVFSGRARRSEYWYFTLFHVIIIYGLTILNAAQESTFLTILVTAYQLVAFIPSLAVGVRRMHDVGKSGWYLLIPIYNLVLACTNGTVGENEYGEDPKGELVLEEEEQY